MRLERIVNDFLQFARPAEPEMAVIAADLLLLETKIFFAPQLEQNRIQIDAGTLRAPVCQVWTRRR